MIKLSVFIERCDPSGIGGIAAVPAPAEKPEEHRALIKALSGGNCWLSFEMREAGGRLPIDKERAGLLSCELSIEVVPVDDGARREL